MPTALSLSFSAGERDDGDSFSCENPSVIRLQRNKRIYKFNEIAN